MHNFFPSYGLADYQAKANPLAKHRLCAASFDPLNLDEVVNAMSPAESEEWQYLSLGYASEQGEHALRSLIAEDYPTLNADNVVVFSGAQEAMFCAFTALLTNEKYLGNRAANTLSIVPCFEPLRLLPKALGGNLICEALKPTTNGWQFDIERYLSKLKTADLAVINFPNNPTGAMISVETQNAIVTQAQQSGAWIFSDEVFRGLEHDPSKRLLPAASKYERAISLGSIAKPYGAGGIRVGWLACQNKELLKEVLRIKQSLSICTGRVDEFLAAQILRRRSELLNRHRKILQGTKAEVVNSLQEEVGDYLALSLPEASMLAFPALRSITDTDRFIKKLLQDTGVMILPGEYFNGGGEEESFKTYFRLGFGFKNFKPVWQRFLNYLVDYKE